MLTLIGEIIKCRLCGYEFGVDEARVCDKCHSHICPKCGECSCQRVRYAFPDGKLLMNYAAC